MKRCILIVMLVFFGFLNAGITIASNARLNVGNANLGIYGNLKNSSSNVTAASTSRLVFTGSANDTITNLYSFPNMTLNKPSGSLRLNNSTNNFLLTGNINFTSGNVITGTNIFEVGSSATVTGESASGYIVGTVKAARVVGTGSNTFGGIGYSMSAGTGNLGTATVYRYSGSGSQVTIFGSQGIWRKWTLETSNAFSGTRSVTSYWPSNEDNGNVLANLKVWKYDPSKGTDETDDDIVPGDRILKRIDLKSSSMKTAGNLEREIVEIDDEYYPGDEYQPSEGTDSKTVGWVQVTGATFNTGSSPRSATYTIDAATTYTINDVSSMFAGGTGTESNPFQVANLDQLNNVRNYLSACFIQTANIDASATTGWNSGAGWVPITSFTGKYNGDGYTVSGLFVNRPTTDYNGLFGSISAGSSIRDLGLINANITGNDYVGAFVGSSSGSVERCYAKGTVGITGIRSGGFMGYSTTGSVVRNCYADVETTRLSGTDLNIGAFCGRLYRGEISNCYSTGAVHYDGTDDPTNKGFLGSIDAIYTMFGNFWNTETSGQLTSAGTATGITSEMMRTLGTFTAAGWDFMGESANGTDDIWGINLQQNNGFPFLSWQGYSHDPYGGFAGGIGTESNPFQIATLDQLNSVRNYMSSNFIQIASIDASPTTGWNSGAGWAPIGNATTKFTGKYNGQGYSISGLFINRTSSYNGLFGYTQGSTISNVCLFNVSITSTTSYNGALVGFNHSSSLVSCSATGTVSGTTYIGGLVGNNTDSSNILGCYSNCTISGTAYNGGLVGRNYNLSNINNSYTDGSVTGSLYYIGGFAGYNHTSCQIRNCYSNTDVFRASGGTYTSYIAGFIGTNSVGAVVNCYSTGRVIYIDSTNPTNRGFAGYTTTGEGYEMSGNFWNIETSGQATTYGTGNATGLTKDQMRTLSTFTNATWDFQDESANGTEDIWGINALQNSGYPFLSWQGITHNPSPFAGGIGTSDEPFLVSNLTQLDAVRNFLSYNFRQTADIDASPTNSWDGGAGWTPLGNNSVRFTGNYDGNGKIISDLYSYRPATDYIALFGSTGTGSSIRNVGVKNAVLTGEDYVGGIVGYMYGGMIERCYSTGQINGLTMLGGFAGYIYMSGTVENCYSGSIVTAVSGSTAYIGGFSGRNFNGTVKKCYSTGSVHYAATTDPTTKGFIGSLGTSQIMSDNFWDMQSSGQSTSPEGATGKTTAEMRSIATYTSLASAGLTNPWDFMGNYNDDAGYDDYWSMHNSLNSGYPYLSWEYRIPVEAPTNLALSVSGSDVIITWNAVTGAAGYLVYSSADPYGVFSLDETGAFNGTQWTAPMNGTKMFYYVIATNETKAITVKTINFGRNASR